MAYRDSTISSAPNASSVPGTMPTTALGDYVCAIILQDTVPAPTWTPPAGWTQIDQQSIATPDAQNITYFELTGGAPSSPPATYTWTSSNVEDYEIIIVSFSGRSLSRTFLTPTTNASTNASPISASFTGGTAANADDLLWVGGVDKATGADTWSFGTPTGSPGTFSLRQNSDVSGRFVGMACATINNISAGATGSIADTITVTGSGSAGYLGYVVAIAAIAGPTINTQPIQTTVYAGETSTFTVAATTSGGSLSYQWTKNGSNVGTSSNSFTTSTLFNTNNLDIYQVAITDSNGTTTSVAVYLIVIPTGSLAWII